MSKYSGKCDFYDWVFSSSDGLTQEEQFNRFKGTKLYKYKKAKDCVEENIRDNWEEIHYDSIKDLVSYYPYIVAIGCRDTSEQDKNLVVLSSESYVDSHEKETVSFYLNEILKYHTQAKRFDKEEVLLKVCWNRYNEDAIKELIDRVEKNGKKATIDGVETTMAKIYREKLKMEESKYEDN